jgi:hypothetical protein
MAKTGSIITEAVWKQHYGSLLQTISQYQNIKSTDVGKAIDALTGSTGRKRLADWSRITRGERLPSQALLRNIAARLRVPFNFLRLSAGYVDETLRCCYAVATERPAVWPYSVRPRRAALAFLFSLFPRPGMHIDARLSLGSIITGDVLHLNVQEGGYLTGEFYNSTWLYPEVFKPEHLSFDEYNPDVTYVTMDGVVLVSSSAEFVPNARIRAEVQIDIASEIAAAILASPVPVIPKQCILYEAQRVLHATSLSLDMRLDHATDVVHAWADNLDGDTANEVREHLQQWVERSVTNEAAEWIRDGSKANRPKVFWMQ